jgi:hypothetical protein
MKKLIITPQGEQLVDLTQAELNQMQIENQNVIDAEKLKQEKLVIELANKQSALNKLKALGLNDAEIKSIIGN